MNFFELGLKFLGDTNRKLSAKAWEARARAEEARGNFGVADRHHELVARIENTGRNRSLSRDSRRVVDVADALGRAQCDIRNIGRNIAVIRDPERANRDDLRDLRRVE